MARILSVVWYKVLPPLFGGQKGIAEFNEHLSRQHTLTCLCSSNNEPGNTPYDVIPELPVTRFQVISPLAWKKIFETIRAKAISHLLLEHCYYGLAGILCKKMMHIRLIVHAHNIESHRFRQEGKWWWPVLRTLEKQTLRQADLVLFKTAEDQDFAVSGWQVRRERTMVVPFGLNRTSIPTPNQREMARYFIREKHQLREGEKILLFAGTLDYEPNARAVKGMVEELIPRLCKAGLSSFRVLVCGRLIDPTYSSLLKLHHSNYLYAGLVEDIEPYMLAADVFLNPVSSGGGIKVKSLEALSFNLPVVCFEHSATGIDPVTAGSKLRVCSDGNWDCLASAATAALEDSSDTPEAFFLAYQWKDIVASVAHRISSL